MADFLPITQFDLVTVSPHFQILKAMIPFFDYPTQRTLSMLIRIQEFQETMRYYKNHNNILNSPNNQKNRSPDSSNISNKLPDMDILNAILPYCPKEYSDMINTFTQAMQMSELMNLNFDFDSNSNPKSSSSEPADKNTTDEASKESDNPPPLNPMLASMLNPEQMSLYNKYLKDLENFNL